MKIDGITGFLIGGIFTVLVFASILGASAGSRDNLINDRGVTVATIDEQGGRLVIRQNGVTLGYYDQSSNTTWRNNGTRVGQGNWLAALVGCM